MFALLRCWRSASRLCRRSPDFVSGSQLFEYLQGEINGNGDFNAGVGSGYVIGVVDTLNRITFCVPLGGSGATIGQINHVVYNYMQQHPQQWNKPAGVVVADALRNSWPCNNR